MADSAFFFRVVVYFIIGNYRKFSIIMNLQMNEKQTKLLLCKSINLISTNYNKKNVQYYIKRMITSSVISLYTSVIGILL